MTRSIAVLFNPPRERWSTARSLLAKFGYADLAAGPKQEFGYTLDFADAGQYEAFMREAEARGFPSDTYLVLPARPVELGDLDAPLGWIQVINRPHGMGGPTYGTTYDLANGCPQCGTGARQLSPLFLRPEDAPPQSNVWQTLDSEVLVSEELGQALTTATGLELRQARSSDDSKALPWFQLIPLHELPPMAATTVGIYQATGSPVAPCKRCRRDGFFTRMEYSIGYELEISDVPDFSHTYEHFGRSVLRKPFKKSHFALPLPIIRKAAYERLIAAGARDVTAEPLVVTDRRWKADRRSRPAT